MNSNEIRQKFLDFFQSKEHTIIESASVVPANDPTVLFNTAGMQPLVPYLMGEKHPGGTRLADVQKCVRTNDLEEVGDNTHLTFFEMLGNWSLGDYFKKETIAWSYEFLTSPKYLNIPADMLAVTVFEGDADAPKDDESATYWQNHNIPAERISYLGKKHNWWGPAGQTGPCGPDTEIFYWVAEGKPKFNSNVKNEELNWMEIWNDVFMEYVKDANGNFNKAAQQNVDTGMGLERITTVLNGKKSVYDTDIFADIISKIEEITGKKYVSGLVINELNFNDKNEAVQIVKSMRIIADHTRTAVIMIADGIVPANTDQGYILRRLIRRAIRTAYVLGVENNFLADIAEVVINKFANIYPSVKENSVKILAEITQEEERFRHNLASGLREFAKLIKNLEIASTKTGKAISEISGKNAFKLYDTYGFPIEMTIELAKEHNLIVDVQGFNDAFKEHQELSRIGSEQKFKGGLADNSEATSSLHTATHLLHESLRRILGKHVEQRGSNITAERLRFDFSHPQKMTEEEKKQVEEMVNLAIKKKMPITIKETSVDEAKKLGAMGLFESKYGEIVKVYAMGDFSTEICGGPHAKNTGDLGVFKIVKEEAVSAGIRRIKAVLE